MCVSGSDGGVRVFAFVLNECVRFGYPTMARAFPLGISPAFVWFPTYFVSRTIELFLVRFLRFIWFFYLFLSVFIAFAYAYESWLTSLTKTKHIHAYIRHHNTIHHFQRSGGRRRSILFTYTSFYFDTLFFRSSMFILGNQIRQPLSNCHSRYAIRIRFFLRFISAWDIASKTTRLTWRGEEIRCKSGKV